MGSLDEEDGYSMREDDGSEAEDFSDLEELDDDESVMEFGSEASGSSDTASIAYSSEEDSMEETEARESIETITATRLRQWMSAFESDTVSTRMLVVILRLFSKWAFPSVLKKRAKEPARQHDDTIELECAESEKTFYDLVFGPVARYLARQRGQMSVSLKRPLRDFLAAMVAFLEEQGRPTDRLNYILKYGLISYLDILIENSTGLTSSCVKPMIKALVRLWCLPSSTDVDSVKMEMEMHLKTWKRGQKRRADETDHDDSCESEMATLKKEEEIRMLAFLLLKKLAFCARNKNIMSMVLKMAYLGLLRNNAMNRAASRASVISFLVNTLTQLWTIDDGDIAKLLKPDVFSERDSFEKFLAMTRTRQILSYQVGFPLLRELAGLLSKVLHEPSKENKGKIVSWKWILACQIWAKLLSTNEQIFYLTCRAVKKLHRKPDTKLPCIDEAHDFPFKLLFYPFMNIAMGSFTWAQSNPSLVPFQLQILATLDQLLVSKPTFAKSVSLLSSKSNNEHPKVSLFISYSVLGIMELVHDKTRPSHKGLKLPSEVKHSLVMADAYLSTRLYSDEVIQISLSLLKKDLIRAADHIAFPELSLALVAKLRSLAKRSRNMTLGKPLLEILRSTQEHTEWLLNYRQKTMNASPFDLATGAEVRSLTDAAQRPIPLHGLQLVNAAGFSLKKGPLFNIK